ncbi:hypothetical protein, partial [Paraburkholderia sediminicola]|uniref:hypothetical protein n=1 Tax=Paraburkholderia sediminicola TaxID=458836 RepID=UPI0038BCE55D
VLRMTLTPAANHRSFFDPNVTNPSRLRNAIVENIRPWAAAMYRHDRINFATFAAQALIEKPHMSNERGTLDTVV